MAAPLKPYPGIDVDQVRFFNRGLFVTPFEGVREHAGPPKFGGRWPAPRRKGSLAERWEAQRVAEAEAEARTRAGAVVAEEHVRTLERGIAELAGELSGWPDTEVETHSGPEDHPGDAAPMRRPFPELGPFCPSSRNCRLGSARRVSVEASQVTPTEPPPAWRPWSGGGRDQFSGYSRWSRAAVRRVDRVAEWSVRHFLLTVAGRTSTIRCMDPELLERITARRAELDELEEQLAEQLAEVRAERDELAVAERVLGRVSEQLADERASTAPAPGQVGGRAVMLIPHRAPDVEENMLPPDYQRILAVVRQAAGPVMARQVGEMLGVEVSVRAKLEPLRGKLVRLVDHGWLRKLPDGRFTTRL